jgi:signal recognition particle subunit SRP72
VVLGHALQVLYRLERYDDAIPAYRALMEADGADGTGDSGMEHATNLVAAMVGHEVATRAAGGTATTHTPPPGEGFEQLYNTSCLLLARGRYADALTAIDAALIDCRDVVTSEVGVTDEEVEAELLLLRVQRGAVLHSLGNDVEASKELHQALKHNVEPTLGAIAAANLIAVNKNHNVFDSRKKLPLVAAPEARAKMTAAQRLLVSKNHVLLLMFMGHTEPLKKQLEEFAEEFPQSDLPCLVKASNLMRRKSAALSRECLQNYIDANPTSSDEVRLVMAQIRIEDEDYDSAVKQLQEVQGLRQSPGFTGVLVELLSLQGRHEEATLTLNNAIGFWEKQTSPEAELNLITLLRAGAAYNVVHSKCGTPSSSVSNSFISSACRCWCVSMDTWRQRGDALTRWQPQPNRTQHHHPRPPQVSGSRCFIPEDSVDRPPKCGSIDRAYQVLCRVRPRHCRKVRVTFYPSSCYIAEVIRSEYVTLDQKLNAWPSLFPPLGGLSNCRQ